MAEGQGAAEDEEEFIGVGAKCEGCLVLQLGFLEETEVHK